MNIGWLAAITDPADENQHPRLPARAGFGKTFFDLFRRVDVGVWNSLQLARKSHSLRSGQAISPFHLLRKIVLATDFTQGTSE